MSFIKSVLAWLKGVFRIGVKENVAALQYDVNPDVARHLDAFVPKWAQIYADNPEWKMCGEHELDRLCMAKVLCEYIAGYNTAECEISVGKDDSPVSVFVRSVLEDNAFADNLQKLDEYKEAFGGAAIKPYNVGNKIKLDYVKAQSFIPLSWDNKRVLEAIFISKTVKGDGLYTLLEIHTFQGGNLVVENRLFKSETSTEALGVEVPLSSLIEYANLLPRAEFPRDTPLFVYIYPAIANNKNFGSPLGISRFANAIDTLKSIDIAFDELQRERDSAAKRIFITDEMVKYRLGDDGVAVRYVDTSERIFQVVGSFQSEENKPFAFDPEFRIQERIADINAMLNLLCLQVGLSAGSLSFDEKEGIKTATEIRSENSRTFKTVSRNQDVLKQAIEDLVESILFLGGMKEFGGIQAEEVEIKVSFDDSITPDRDTYINEGVKLHTASLLSKLTFLQQYFGMTEDDALAEIERIKAETPAVPDVYGGFN